MKDVGDLARSIDSAVAPTSLSIRETADAAAAAMMEADTLLNRLEVIAVEDRAEIRNAARELAATARALRVLAEYLETHPDAVIWGKK